LRRCTWWHIGKSGASDSEVWAYAYDLVNKVVEVVGPGKFTIRKLPRTDSSHAK
jgi:hypothetical protein